MRFDIRGQHIEVTEGLRAHAARRLQFALSRFEPRIARVTVRLADLSGGSVPSDRSPARCVWGKVGKARPAHHCALTRAA